jgi:hypothetical protein
MTETNDLRTLKLIAKRFARAHRIAQHQALDLVAGHLDFPNWVKLVTASKKGWQAGQEGIAAVEAFARGALSAATIRKGDAEAMARRFTHLEEADHGMIGEHPYRLHDVLHDVVMTGEGWSVRVPENPSAIAIVESYATPGTICPVFDPGFLQAALNIARDRASQVRGKISTDWPRRSTKPDLDGVVRHPLDDSESNVWFCYHCDGMITGIQVAQNLWHCPACGASPLDIYDTAFWSEDEGKSFLPIETNAGDRQDIPALKIVDGRPKLDLNEEKIVLLVRSALIEEATNVSERLGALHAEISVDEDNDVCIIFDIDLWPEDKDPTQALAVAGVLGINVDVACTQFTIPFAWPDLGQITSSTSEYTRIMLDAYAEHGSFP